MPAVKAFAEAEGFGACSLGMRGGTGPPKCYLINTLADNADTPVQVAGQTYTSSWRSFFKASGPRAAVPLVGGTCVLTINDPGASTSSASIEITDSYFTVLGGMAPGGGVCIQGELRFRCNQKIVRHMRFRGGSDFVDDINDSVGMRGVLSTGNTEVGGIFDHCSISGGRDNNASVGNDWHTVSNCILGPEFFRGMLIGSQSQLKVSLLGNLQYQNIVRQPLVSRGTIEYRHNVIAASRSNDASKSWFEPGFGTITLNCQGNSYFIFAPEVPIPTNPAWNFTKPIRESGEAHVLNIYGTSQYVPLSAMYYEDNYDEHWRPTGAEAEDANVHVHQGATDGPPRVGSPTDFSTDSNYVVPVTLTSTAARAAVLHATTGAGAWRTRDASALFAVSRDSLDTTLLANMGFSPVRGLSYPTSTNVTTISGLGGWPSLADGLVGGSLPSTFTSTGDRGGIPDSYTLPGGAMWYDIRDDNGRTFLEGYAYGEPRYWDAAENAPTVTLLTQYSGSVNTAIPINPTIFDVDDDAVKARLRRTGSTLTFSATASGTAVVRGGT